MGRARRAAPGEAALHLGVRLTRVGTKVRGELRMMDGPGDGDTRRVDGESCDAVVEVLSLTAALALVGQPQHATPPPPAPPRPARPAPPPRSVTEFLDDAVPGSVAQAAGTDARRPRRRSRPSRPNPEKTPVIVKPPPRAARTCRHPVSARSASCCCGRQRHHQFDQRGRRARRAPRTPRGRRARAHRSASPFYMRRTISCRTPTTSPLHWTALAVTGCPPCSLGRILTLQPCAQGIGGWLSATGRGITQPKLCPSELVERGCAFARRRAPRGWFCARAGGRGVGSSRPATFYVGSTGATVGKTPTIAP